MNVVYASTLRGHQGWLSCEIIGPQFDRTTVVFSADPPRWADIAAALAATGNQVVVVEVTTSLADELLPDLTCAVRFLPECHCMMADGVAAAALLTVVGEQRLRPAEIIAVAMEVVPSISGRLEAALPLVEAAISYYDSVGSCRSALAPSRRD
jgi:uncharacterized Fe-S cluster-containing protein